MYPPNEYMNNCVKKQQENKLHFITHVITVIMQTRCITRKQHFSNKIWHPTQYKIFQNNKTWHPTQYKRYKLFTETLKN